MPVTIRPLLAADAEEYLTLLRRGIAEHPTLFRSSPEDVAHTWAGFVTPCESDFTLGAFSDDGQMVGVVSFAQEKRSKRRHTGLVYLMYVAPEAAGRGTGRHLLREVITRVRMLPELTHLTLTVSASNECAKHLYASEGFETFALEKRALKIGGVFYDEEQMALHLGEVRFDERAD